MEKVLRKSPGWRSLPLSRDGLWRGLWGHHPSNCHPANNILIFFSCNCRSGVTTEKIALQDPPVSLWASGCLCAVDTLLWQGGCLAVCQIPVLSPPPRSACPSCPALCSSCSLLAQKPSTITGTVLWLCSNVSRPQVRLDFRCVLACLELCFSLCSYKKDFLMTKWLLPHLLNFCLALELRKIIWYNHMVTLLGLIIMSIQTIATTW